MRMRVCVLVEHVVVYNINYINAKWQVIIYRE